ncbi:YeeE/YedE family protein [Alteromonadaceae bacterium BrNp21-10]|nr:YeeE/YedE family protein [Alteromonadaceae bacterium BrNp21-10]
MKNITIFIAGLLFGLGLTVAQMTSPEKVLSFLDISGNWDPSLALVMLGALAVSAIGVMLSKSMKKPLLAELFNLPTSQIIDRKLIIGAALFGTGWGLVGYCPGPAIASLAYASQPLLIFIAAMFGGMFIAKRWL